MIYVGISTYTTAWTNNQKSQFQRESDVRLTIYSKGETTATQKQVLTKVHLSSYSFNETNDVLCKQLPDVEVSFSVIKNDNITYQFSKGDLVKVEYGFMRSATQWQWGTKGVYEITDVSIKQNNLTADYVAKYINWGIWNTTYNGGSVDANLNSNIAQNVQYFFYFFDKSFKNIIENTDGKQATQNGYFQFVNKNLMGRLTNNLSSSADASYFYIGTRFNNMTYLELAQALAQCVGCSFRIDGSISGGNYYTTLTFYKLDNADLHPYVMNTDRKKQYQTLYKINFLKQPEVIENERYGYVNLISKKYNYLTTYQLSNHHSNSSMTIDLTANTTTTFKMPTGLNVAGGHIDSNNVISAWTYGNYGRIKVNTAGQYTINLWSPVDDEQTTKITLDTAFSREATFRKLDDMTYSETALYVPSWLSHAELYDCAMRIDPRFECLDYAFIEDDNVFIYVVEGISFRYKGGGFNGNMKLRKVGLSNVISAPTNMSFSRSGAYMTLTLTNPNNFDVVARVYNYNGTTGLGKDLCWTSNDPTSYNYVQQVVSANSSATITLQTSGNDSQVGSIIMSGDESVLVYFQKNDARYIGLYSDFLPFVS